LSVSDSNDLWEGLKNNDHTQYWKSNYKLIPEISSLKNIPIRLFIFNQSSNIVPTSPNSNPSIIQNSNSPQIQPFTCMQFPISPCDSTGAYRTLGNIITEVIPHLENLIVESKLKLIRENDLNLVSNLSAMFQTKHKSSFNRLNRGTTLTRNFE